MGAIMQCFLLGQLSRTIQNSHGAVPFEPSPRDSRNKLSSYNYQRPRQRFFCCGRRDPLAKRTYYFEHISRTLQAKFGMHARVVLNTHLRFVYTEEKFQPGLQKLDEALRTWLAIFSVRAL